MRPVLLGVAALAVAACASEVPPPAEPKPRVAPPPAATFAAPPAWFVIPGAEASARAAAPQRAPDVAPLHSDGRRHALARTAYGIVIASEADGVLGFLRRPAPGGEVRWAGFVDDDAILL